MAAIASAQPASVSGSQRGDQAFSLLLRAASLIAVLVLSGLVVVLISGSTTTLSQFGLGFLTSQDWDPPNQIFGAGAYIYGTVVTSMIALILATPFSLGAALFVSEYAPPCLGSPTPSPPHLLVPIPTP